MANRRELLLRTLNLIFKDQIKGEIVKGLQIRERLIIVITFQFY